MAAGGKPEHLPFRSLLRGTDADVGPRMAEMRAAFEKNPNLAHKAEFNRLDTEYARVKSLVAGDAPVDAVTWAGAQSFLDNLQEKSEVVYWRVRLAQLNETL